ncbi:colicin V biosynthesis protein [Agaricicola taiwanensis]|uniref:Colicin V biosynthesis protein n=1 Tax=Agaricicola taiwanensis TaxID=591372 RepID=A0A8J2YJG3_9RHOB|nr:CvpA family protein [Agaricicola taiwanensis]GGE46972.1 colicin V biosynthesis protein [Agaricicola taiwanensis]
MPITLLDVIVIAVMLLSALLAMVRGFTREVLSVVSWIAAAAATLYFFPMLQPWMREQITVEPLIIADVITGAVIFIGTLIVVSLVTIRISDLVLDSRIGPLDRSLGFLYGAGRGFILAVIAFLFFGWLVPERSQPVWAQQAQSRMLLENTGESMLALLPEDLEETIFTTIKRSTGEGEQPTVVPDGETQGPSGATQQPEQETSGSNSDLQRLLTPGGASN